MDYKFKRKALAFSMIGAVALSGCTSVAAIPSGAQSAEVVDATKPPVSDGATLPVKPKASLEHSNAGLEATIRYWVDLHNYALATGDTAALEKLSAVDCEYCQSEIAEINSVYKDGGRIEGAQLSVAELGANLDVFGDADGDKKYVRAILALERKAGTAISPDDKVLKEYESVRVENVTEFWDTKAYDKEGNFVGSIISIWVDEPAFEANSGWQKLNLQLSPQ